MMNSNRYFNFVLVFSSLLSFFGIIYLLYISNKGLDFTDEIYNLQGFLHPKEYKYNQTYFSIVILKFFPFLEYNIVNIRILRLFFSVFASFFLAYSYVKCFVNHQYVLKNKEFYFLFSFFFIANILTYSTGYQILSYNTFSSVLIQFLLATFFIIYSNIKLDKLTVYNFLFYSTTIGLLALALFMTKFPTVITVFIPIEVLILISIYKYKKKINFITYFILIIFSNAIAFVVFSNIVFGQTEGFFLWLNDFKLTLNNLEGRDLTYLFSRYFDSIKEFHIQYLEKYFLFFFLYLVIVFLINRLKEVKIKQILFGFICVLNLLFFTYNDFLFAGSKYEGTQSFWLIGTVLFFLFLLLISTNKKTFFSIDFLIALFLFFIPIISSLGTNNWLTYQVNIYPVFWFLFIYYSQKFLVKIDKHFYYSIFLVIILVASFQMYFGSYYYPYRIHQTISNQNNKVISLSDGAELFIHKKEKNTMDSVNLLLSKTDFRVGDPVFTYMHQSGISYLIGGKILGFCMCTDYGNGTQNCFIIDKTIKNINTERLFIILPKQRNDSIETIKCLKNHGADLNKMIKLGEVSYSIYDQQIPLEIYSPKSRIKNDSIFSPTY